MDTLEPARADGFGDDEFLVSRAWDNSQGGAILTIGEEYSGYRLVSVHEGEAVLSKNGEAVRLFVDDSDE